jgi:nicotinamide mononucleotide transporter
MSVVFSVPALTHSILHYATSLTIHPLDPIGACCSLISTILFVRANKYAWPAGMLATLINLALYLQQGIYGEMSLEIVYFLSCVYGWYLWSGDCSKGPKKKPRREISNLPLKHGSILMVIAVCGIMPMAYFLKHELHSTVPYLDATTTILSLVGQWLTCQKIIESWGMWFVVDSLYIGMYINKGIPFHALKMIFYVGLAVIGYLRWRKMQLRNDKPLYSVETQA